MNLAQLQGAYRSFLLDGSAAAIAPAIVEDAFDAEERLRIYRNNFLIGLGEALKANFPVTLQLLGEDFFAQAARTFILRAPPAKPCLFEYGAGFADYLAGLAELAALPYVPEVARFEFARIEAYHAPVEALLSDVEMARIPPQALADLPIRLARHVRLVSVRYPVVELWQAHQAPQPDLGGIDMAPQPHALLVCRPQRTLAVQVLDSDAVLFLNAARERITLALAAEACGPDMDADRLGQVIGMALQHRLLVNPR